MTKAAFAPKRQICYTSCMIADRTMKAAVVTGYGSPERLTLCDVPTPQPAKNEVRVRVHASTVNRTDTATLRAHPFFMRAATGLLRPQMQSLGMDFAGVVDALGTEVSSFQVGDRVFGMSSERFGAHAEYLCIPVEDAIAHIPEGIPYDQAVVGEGAWYAHGTTKLLTEGKRCLIYGASGAIGTAAVQLAKANGAYVVAVVGTRHTSLANALGADRVVNYETEDFTAIGETFDLVFDAVGKTSRRACRPLLKKNAVYCATDMGPYWSNMLLAIWFGLTGSKRVRIPFPEDAPGFIKHLADLMAQGKFRGVFDRTYPLKEIASAFQYVETEQKTGIVGVDTLGK
ncbi:2-haloacrylate reductase [Aliiroseovarius pelagivivens]|uniref:2-haloacrylate reductase n=2 Tax=Aliiroseovarius pelagivivens TaxID=1639690 RepID=A0A2R8AGN4_9RHOB|nr:2-haloacrylate reductase [Aliiroseovarius pelagivivens]